MIALVGVSVSSCSINDSQERQWDQVQERVCQALDGGHIAKAEGILEEELRRIGPHKPYLRSRCLSAAGKLYRYNGEADKAAVLLTQLLDIKENVDKKRHLKLPHVLIEVADCYIDQKKYAEAIDFLQRAAVLEQSMNADYMIPCLRKLAQCYESLNNKEKAQFFYQLAIDADARQQGVAEEKRSDLLLFDEANLMWDYSSFLARQKQEAQSEAMEARADHLFKILVDRSGKPKPDDKFVLGFKSDSDAAKVANLVNVLVEKGNYEEAEELLDRFYDISVDLAGLADNEADSHAQFVAALHTVWCTAKGSIERTVSNAVDENLDAKSSEEHESKSNVSKEEEALLSEAKADFKAGRLDDAETKAAAVVLKNGNSREGIELLVEIAKSTKRLQEAQELKLRLKKLRRD